MTKLKLGAIADAKPVKISIELPAELYADLTKYAELLSSEQGQPIADPAKLVIPMLIRFIATDRGFSRLKRTIT
ncbi:DUF2274 domain-containing protein [Roseomonas mucosa]|nr:DUF2274 domain-containing protein [Roseomonas mucosa]